MLSSALALLLFCFCFFSSLLIALWPAATHLCIKCVIVYLVISYLLYISLSLSLFAVYVSVVRVVLSSYNFLIYLIFNDKEEEDDSAVLQ